MAQAFVEVIASGESITAPMDATYDKLGIDPASVTTLDSYLAEYYQSILKKLKEVGAEVSDWHICVDHLMSC